MKLDDILAEWEKDGPIDRTELSLESVNTPKLHHKYYKMYVNERLRFVKQEQEYKKLFKLKHEYYRGLLDQETLQEKGWEPFRIKLLKEEISTYLDADDDISALQLKITYQKEILATLQEIIKQINARQYMIKNSIEWEKFTNGQ